MINLIPAATDFTNGSKDVLKGLGAVGAGIGYGAAAIGQRQRGGNESRPVGADPGGGGNPTVAQSRPQPAPQPPHP